MFTFEFIYINRGEKGLWVILFSSFFTICQYFPGSISEIINSLTLSKEHLQIVCLFVYFYKGSLVHLFRLGFPSDGGQVLESCDLWLFTVHYALIYPLTHDLYTINFQIYSCWMTGFVFREGVKPTSKWFTCSQMRDRYSFSCLIQFRHDRRNIVNLLDSIY